jgi:hypothetical protein
MVAAAQVEVVAVVVLMEASVLAVAVEQVVAVEVVV